MLQPATLRAAQDQIASDFALQCEHGIATARLPSDQASCGRVLKAGANPQFGLYGTAAAVRVLADRPDERSRSLVRRLVRFLEVYLLGAGPSDVHPDKLTSDRDNVIKLGEVLFALEKVRVGVVDVGPLINHIGDRLRDGIRDGLGWGYFLSDQQSQPLPTAIALRALAVHKYDVDKPRAFVTKSLDRQSNSDSDIFVQVLCTYVLATIDPVTSTSLRANRATIRAPHDRQWRSLRALLSTDLEANVEYPGGSRYSYIRVPWQLYLIGCARRVRPIRHFASVAAQRRLGVAVVGVSSDHGFVYPHSGNEVSARTASILYDVLGDTVTGPWLVWRAIVATDRARSALIRYGRIPLALLAGGFGAYSMFVWITGSTAAVGEVGTNLIASVLVAIVVAATKPRG